METNPTPQQQFAKSCLAAGWFIFPLGVKSKIPDSVLAPHGFQSATNDPKQIEAWWTASPNANIGVDLGRSNLTVLDFDQGRPPEELIPYLQSTYVVKTSRGAHVYFQGVSKQGKMYFNGKHIGEVKSAGGYVLAPTSEHPEGPIYAVIGNSPIQALPDDLLAKIFAAPAAIPSSERRLLRHGQLHGAYVAEAGRLWNRGYEAADVVEMTVRWTVANSEDSVDEAKVRKEAANVTNIYKRGEAPETAQLVLNQRPDGADYDEETFADEREEKFPECPIFTGALTDLARALFPSLPLEFKQWGLIARWGLMRSGVDTFGFEKHLQPRFYSVFVCYPNRGKTACINETRTAADNIAKSAVAHFAKTGKPMLCADVENLPSIDSGQFLADEFYRLSQTAREQAAREVCLDNSAKIMMDPDEMSDIFEKGRVLNGRQSTLFIELLKLYSGNRTGNATKKDGKRNVDNAHLALLGGTTVKKYPMLWTGTGGGADGLVSRFVPITTNNPPIPPAPLPTDLAAAEKAYERLYHLAQLPPQNVVLTEDAGKMLNDWWASFDNGKESTTRVVEIIKQLLIVLAVVNAPDDHKESTLTVGTDLMGQAVAFGEYVIAVRERLNPSDSWSNLQAMENAIIEWARKNASRNEPKTRNECRRGVHPNRKPGGLATFNFAWDSCVKAGVMKLRMNEGKGQRFSL